MVRSYELFKSTRQHVLSFLRPSVRTFYSFLLVFTIAAAALLGFAQDGFCAQVSLAWDRNTQPEIAGYKVYWRKNTESYLTTANNADAGSGTTYTVTPLNSGTNYCFVATAYTSSTAESGYSNEVCTTTPTGTNNPPVASNRTLTVLEDTAGSGTLVATDADGNPMTYSLVDNAAHGTVVITNATSGAFRYTPAGNFNGTDTFTYKANDGTANSNTATVSITVAPVNDAPVANNLSITTNKATPKSGTVTASDVDSNPLTFALVGNCTHGSLSVAANGSFTYTPSLNYSGPDSFTFRANDGTANSNTATVNIAVNSVNVAPVAYNLSITATEDTPKTGTVTASDADGNPLIFALVDNCTHGSVSITANGSFTYTPSLNYNGPDSFTFRANDGTANSNTATVSITINPVNDTPVASNGTVSVAGTQAKTGALTASDVDGDTLRYSIVANGQNGTATVDATTGTYTYTAGTGVSGTDTFTFRVNDGSVDSNTATVTVTLSSAVNQAPVADAGPDQTVVRRSRVTLNGSKSTDPNDGIASRRWTRISGPRVTLSSATSITPTFTAPYVTRKGAAITFRLSVTDKAGLQSSDTCVVNVTYASTTASASPEAQFASTPDTPSAARSKRSNQPPTANAGPDARVAEGAKVQLDASNSTDSDDGIASCLWQQTAGPTVTLSDAKALTPSFLAPAAGQEEASLTFTLTVTDKGGLIATDTCVVNVSSVSTPPQASAGVDQTVFQGALVTLDGSASASSDGAVPSYRWTQASGPPVSLLTEPTAPQIVFTAPDVNCDGARLTFLLTVTDTLGLQSTDVVTVNVNETAGLNLTGNWSSFSHATRTVSGSLAVQNIGSRKIGAFRTSFYASEDGITPGQPLSRKTLKSLAVAQTRQLRFRYSKVANLKGKYILAVIDSADQVKETNKGDNQVVVKLP